MSKRDKDKDNEIEITEMWLAEAGDKCFFGIIRGTKNAQGKPHLFSRITINDGNVQACANDQKVLSKMLDEMCLLYLNGLHSDVGVYIEIFGDKYFLN